MFLIFNVGLVVLSFKLHWNFFDFHDLLSLRIFIEENLLFFIIFQVQLFGENLFFLRADRLFEENFGIIRSLRVVLSNFICPFLQHLQFSQFLIRVKRFAGTHPIALFKAAAQFWDGVLLDWWWVEWEVLLKTVILDFLHNTKQYIFVVVLEYPQDFVQVVAFFV